MAEKTAYVRIDGTNVPIKFYDMKDDWIEYDGGQCLSINVDDVIYQAYCNAEPYENISHHLRFIDKDGNERVVYDIKRVSTVTANLIETLSSGASNKTYSFPYGGAIILTGGNATGGVNGNTGGTGSTASYYSTASGGKGGAGGTGGTGYSLTASITEVYNSETTTYTVKGYSPLPPGGGGGGGGGGGSSSTGSSTYTPGSGGSGGYAGTLYNSSSGSIVCTFKPGTTITINSLTNPSYTTGGTGSAGSAGASGSGGSGGRGGAGGAGGRSGVNPSTSGYTNGAAGITGGNKSGSSGGSGGRGGTGASGSVIPAGYPTVTNGTWNGMETHGYYYNGEARTEYYFKSVNDGSDGTPVLTNNDASFIASALTSYRGQCRVYSFDLDT